MVKQIKDIIEHPRKPHSSDQPYYQSDVYNLDEAERQNKTNLGKFNQPKRGSCLEEVNINFAARKNNRSE